MTRHAPRLRMMIAFLAILLASLAPWGPVAASPHQATMSSATTDHGDCPGAAMDADYACQGSAFCPAGPGVAVTALQTVPAVMRMPRPASPGIAARGRLAQHSHAPTPPPPRF